MKTLTLASSLFALGAVGCVDNHPGKDPDITEKTAPIGACGSIETHVVGIYESPNGQASVNITRPGRHSVVVSAWEATNWTIVSKLSVMRSAVVPAGNCTVCG